MKFVSSSCEMVRFTPRPVRSVSVSSTLISTPACWYKMCSSPIITSTEVSWSKLSMLEPLVALLFVDALVLCAVSTTFICAKPNPLLPSGCSVRWFLLYLWSPFPFWLVSSLDIQLPVDVQQTGCGWRAVRCCCCGVSWKTWKCRRGLFSPRTCTRTCKIRE